VFKGAEIEKKEHERRSTGIPICDFITNGGLPRPGMIELGGEYSCGKTTIALHMAAHTQREEPELNIGWVALEPFSKRWARENGLWIPFSEEHGDPLDGASNLEKLRMKQLGIKDPYSSKGFGEVILVQDDRGDAALDASLMMLRSNLFSIIVVDSLGVAKPTKWLESADVQDAGDFPREARMINDYTTRAVLALNGRYDENNQRSKDGTNPLRTTLIHINHIMMNIGSMARSPWKKQVIKGGEGQKHNHHAIMFLWKGQPLSVPLSGGGRYVFGQEVNVIGIKSKIGPPFLQGKIDMYFQDYGHFHAGDFDTAKDAMTLGLLAGLIDKAGSWFTIDEERRQGRESMEEYLRDQPEIMGWLVKESIQTLRSS
jgi:recombination protein RecA